MTIPHVETTLVGGAQAARLDLDETARLMCDLAARRRGRRGRIARAGYSLARDGRAAAFLLLTRTR